MLRLTKKKLIRYVLLPNIILFTALAIYFPGSQLLIALTLATGIHGGSLQARIDACEAKAIEGADFSKEEIKFLRDLYTCLYKGARLTLILPEVSKLMDHYLAGSGEDLEVDPSIFKTNDKVIEQMELLRARMTADASLQERYRSEVFYMPDFSNIDSVFGLYYGHIEARPEKVEEGLQIKWRAEVPWEWPSYKSLQEKHGDPQAESFPIPNFSCLFLGLNGAIYLDNGLGEYLTRLGIAKSFLAYAEWREIIENE
ncbi:MAG TPA: hypothetical protein VJ952_08130 [Opitutales bacterium]|nr:hypothetical protein [Opitutales bacterium]